MESQTSAPNPIPGAPPPDLEMPSLTYDSKPSEADKKLKVRRFNSRVERDRTGALMFSLIGNMLVKVAMKTEPRGAVRQERGKRLTRLWRNYSSKALNITRGRA